jgi:hypothetical protein
MFYEEGVKFAFAQLGLTKEALSPVGFGRGITGIIGAGRGALRGGLVGGATGLVAGEPGDRMSSALRGAGYGALFGGAAGGVGSAIRGGRVARRNAEQLEQALSGSAKLPPSVAVEMAQATRPTLLGSTAGGVLGGFHGASPRKE